MGTRRYGSLQVETSNEDKVLFPEDGITKGEIIDYYEKIAEHLLPHLKERPLVMQRFPDGIEEGGFYHKEVPDHFPDWITTTTVSTGDGRQRLVVCERAATLGFLANQGCLTIHAWLSRVGNLDHPDMVAIDLDPWDGAFEEVRQAAFRCREVLDELGVTSFLKTSGSRGVHIVVPLDRSASFDAARSFAADLAGEVARRDPDRLTTEVRKRKREGRLFLDVARNAHGQTMVAPYALRARKGAPVAVPLDWEELEDPDLTAQSWTLRNILRRLGQRDDPWKGMHRHACSLDALRRRLAKLRNEEAD